MKKLFEIKPVDRKFYERNIRDFLPEKIIDIHAHVWMKEKRREAHPRSRVQAWPSLVAAENPVEDLAETYRLLFPGRKVAPLIFNSPTTGGNIDRLNGYASGSAAKYGLSALMLSRPEWAGEEFWEKITAGGFRGVKPYLSFAPEHLPSDEIRIFDFIPNHQLEILNKHGLILMLHIPRPERLKDPVNLAQLLEIEKSFPRIKVIIAHVGRAYCPRDTAGAFSALKGAKNLMFDISANTNSTVFLELIKAAGPGRILFGSDLPITRMRMKRVCRRGRYINIVPEGLYGDVSGEGHMEETSGTEAEKLTFFLYEEIDAFRRASNRAGLNPKEVQDVFHNNASRLLKEAVLTEQLLMELPETVLKKYPVPVKLPEHYSIRTYRKGDDSAYVKLMKRAGFSGWDNPGPHLNRALPGGVFFALEKKTGKLAGTCSATHNPTRLHPFGGELGPLAVHPAHRGQGLGEYLSQSVINRFGEAGYRNIYLRTDDFRLAAIKTYLNLGFIPAPHSPGMKKRWMEIYKTLNLK